MEKKIIITINQSMDAEHNYAIQTELTTEGAVSPFELLGILRHFEKQVWMRISSAEKDFKVTNKID
jgi:hypothetical protein